MRRRSFVVHEGRSRRESSRLDERGRLERGACWFCQFSGPAVLGEDL